MVSIYIDQHLHMISWAATDANNDALIKWTLIILIATISFLDDSK